MQIPQISCLEENHMKMPFQYVCLSPHCQKNSQQLACIYCCQQKHNSHLQSISAIKIMLQNFQKQIRQTDFGAAQILLKGVQTCKSQIDLRHNLCQIYAFEKGAQKFQRIIDTENQKQKQQVKQFYERKAQPQCRLQRTVKKRNNKQTQQNLFIKPIFTFLLEDAKQQNYKFISPFCVSNLQQKLVTAFAYPSLDKFNSSIQISIKIQKITPFWLGIGLSLGKKQYKVGSKDHIILTSNGWISMLGELKQSPIKYCIKDTVKLRIDKNLQLAQFSCNSQKQMIPLQIKWNQQIYICCVLYYKEDSVQLLSA